MEMSQHTILNQRKMHNEKLHDFYISPSIIWMISWRMYWVGHFHAWGSRQYVRAWTGLIWLRTGTSGRLLWTQ